MAYAILRHAKITSQDQATKATAHNYRQYPVLNADAQPAHPNVEFVNPQERNYWELAEERIAEAGITIRRKDAVRCVEIVLTASPEFFQRDERGRAVDMQDSQWMKDIRTYLTATFGEKNLIGLQIQQDEKSPHIHALVVPITPDNRLSARDVFNPATLRAYQTNFAEAMKPHGLSRGVEHSQAEHRDMKQMYAQQGQTAVELGAQLGPASSYQDVQVKRPGAKDVLNLSEWEARTSAQVNEQARAQVEAANQRAEKAHNLAQESASAKDQVRVLQKQLLTSERLKEANYAKFQAEQAKVDDVAMRVAGGEQPGKKFVERGHRLLDVATERVVAGRAQLEQLTKQADQAERTGDYAQVAEIRYGGLKTAQESQDEAETKLRGYRGGATRLDELTAQQAQAQAAELNRQAEEKRETERVATEQARLAREAAEQERLRLANAAAESIRKQVEEAAERERQKPLVRENERQQIERTVERILQINPHIYQREHLEKALNQTGVDVWIVDAKRRFALKGSENEFGVADIRPGGRPLEEVVNERLGANQARFDREWERDRGKSAGYER